MITLRDYQLRTRHELYAWFEKFPGNPCIVLPTGAGKSLVIADICQNALQSWPDTKILMLTARSELIEQNADKLRKLWPNAPLGIYSAAMNLFESGAPITFAGIQSVRNKAWMLGKIDICLIDEAHEISHKDEGSYRFLIRALLEKNPAMRVVGLTATPYRLGHGLIIDKPAIFDDLIEPVSIVELQARGYLAKLTSKSTKRKLDLTGVHIRGGDFKDDELQAAVDTELNNEEACAEIIERAGDRKAWIIFCTGVDHAEHIATILNERGISSACVTGKTLKSERERLIAEYKAGRIRALTGAEIFTTGFDYPDIDLIAMLRPTKSPGLYCQMAGRGLRVKSNGGDCLVLDFAGNVEEHGPITAIRTPKQRLPGEGIAPSKLCPECDEIVAIQCHTCPSCGYEFPVEKKDPAWMLGNQDIMGGPAPVIDLDIHSWDWTVQTSKKSGKEMIVLTYYPEDLSHEPLKEYLCVYHEGYAGIKAITLFKSICKDAGLVELPDEVSELNRLTVAPKKVQFQKDGKFNRIVSREWEVVPF